MTYNFKLFSKQRSPTLMADLLHITDFSPWLHDTFMITFAPGMTLPAELTSVKEVNSYTPVDRKPFSLIFRTTQKTEYFQQSLCILQHPEKGDVPLFLVPIGFDDQGMRYEAVFA